MTPSGVFAHGLPRRPTGRSSPPAPRRPRLAFAFFFLLILAGPAASQNPGGEAPVTPRLAPASPAPPQDVLTPHARPLTVNVDLVLVPVTITDPMGRPVLGLSRNNFRVYEDKQLQSIEHFSSGDVPVSLGVILDASGSMAGEGKMEEARQAVSEFFRIANPRDEAFMITFSSRPELTCDFTDDLDGISGQLIYTAPRKTTALLDAIYLGLSKMRQARYSRKALLIISDGGDNSSRYTQREVKSLVKESDTLIYAIGVFSRFLPTVEERWGPMLLSEVAEASGGRSFSAESSNDLPDIAAKIGLELRNQYLLGYRPSSAALNGKWRKIKVKVLPPKGLPPLQVYAKKGYYSASP